MVLEPIRKVPSHRLMKIFILLVFVAIGTLSITSWSLANFGFHSVCHRSPLMQKLLLRIIPLEPQHTSHQNPCERLQEADLRSVSRSPTFDLPSLLRNLAEEEQHLPADQKTPLELWPGDFLNLEFISYLTLGGVRLALPPEGRGHSELRDRGWLYGLLPNLSSLTFEPGLSGPHDGPLTEQELGPQDPHQEARETRPVEERNFSVSLDIRLNDPQVNLDLSDLFPLGPHALEGWQATEFAIHDLRPPNAQGEKPPVRVPQHYASALGSRIKLARFSGLTPWSFDELENLGLPGTLEEIIFSKMNPPDLNRVLELFPHLESLFVVSAHTTTNRLDLRAPSSDHPLKRFFYSRSLDSPPFTLNIRQLQFLSTVEVGPNEALNGIGTNWQGGVTSWDLQDLPSLERLELGLSPQVRLDEQAPLPPALRNLTLRSPRNSRLHLDDLGPLELHYLTSLTLSGDYNGSLSRLTPSIPNLRKLSISTPDGGRGGLEFFDPHQPGPPNLENLYLGPGVLAYEEILTVEDVPVMPRLRIYHGPKIDGPRRSAAAQARLEELWPALETPHRAAIFKEAVTLLFALNPDVPDAMQPETRRLLWNALFATPLNLATLGREWNSLLAELRSSLTTASSGYREQPRNDLRTTFLEFLRNPRHRAFSSQLLVQGLRTIYYALDHDRRLRREVDTAIIQTERTFQRNLFQNKTKMVLGGVASLIFALLNHHTIGQIGLSTIAALFIREVMHGYNLPESIDNLGNLQLQLSVRDQQRTRDPRSAVRNLLWKSAAGRALMAAFIDASLEDSETRTPNDLDNETLDTFHKAFCSAALEALPETLQ